MIPFECPNCRAEFQLQDEFAGKSGKCPKCAQPLKVPALDLPGEPQSVENVTECKPALGGGEEKLWEEIVGNIFAGPFIVFFIFLTACGLQWFKKKFWESSEPVIRGAHTQTRIWDAVYTWQFWAAFTAVSLVISSVFVIKTVRSRPRR